MSDYKPWKKQNKDWSSAPTQSVNEYNRGQYWDAPVQNPDKPWKKFTPDPNYYQHKDINDITNRLVDAGQSVPAPDVENVQDKPWYQKYIFDPLNKANSSVSTAVKNLVDDDKSTGFFKGFGEGWKSSSGSWKDVLESIITSENDVKRKIGVGVTWLTNNAISNLIHPGDQSKFIDANEFATAWKGEDRKAVEKFAKDRTYSGGFIGDAILDPLNYINGVAKGAKLIGKGSDALKAAEKGIDASKALDVMQTLGKGNDIKEAEYLAEKTAKTLGYMPDYKGITLGTTNHNITLVKPETLGKLGDTLSSAGVNPFKAVDKIFDSFGKSYIGKTLKQAFGSVDADTIEYARNNPEKAIEVIASNMNKKSLWYKWNNSAMHNLIEKTKKYQENLGGADNEKLVTKAKEAGNVEEKYLETITKTVKNPEYSIQVNNRRKFFRQQLESLKTQRDELALSLKNADAVTRAKNLADLSNLDKQLKIYDAVPRLHSIEYGKQLENAGINIDNIFDTSDDMANEMVRDVMYAGGNSIDDIVEHLKAGQMLGYVKDISEDELVDVAIKMKRASDQTMESMREIFGDLMDYYIGSGSASIDEIMKSGAGFAMPVDNIDDMLLQLQKEKTEIEKSLKVIRDKINSGMDYDVNEYRNLKNELEEIDSMIKEIDRKRKATPEELEASKKLRQGESLINGQTETKKAINTDNPVKHIKYRDINAKISLNDFINYLVREVKKLTNGSDSYNKVMKMLGGDVNKSYDLKNMNLEDRIKLSRELQERIGKLERYSNTDKLTDAQKRYIKNLNSYVDSEGKKMFKHAGLSDDIIDGLTKREANEVIEMLQNEKKFRKIEDTKKAFNEGLGEITEKPKYGLESRTYDDTGIKKNGRYDDETPKKIQEQMRDKLYKAYMDDGDANIADVLGEFDDDELKQFVISRQNALGEYSPETDNLDSLSRTELENLVHDYTEKMFLEHENPKVVERVKAVRKDIANKVLSTDQKNKLERAWYNLKKYNKDAYEELKDTKITNVHEYKKFINEVYGKRLKDVPKHSLLDTDDTVLKTVKTKGGVVETLEMPDTKADFHKFSTEQGIFKVDTKANMEYVNRVRNLITQLPEELQDIAKTQSFEIIAGTMKRGDLTAGGTRFGGGSIVLWDNKSTRKMSDDKLLNMIEHELGHALSATNRQSRTYVIKKMQNEILKLNAEQKQQLVQAIKNSRNPLVNGKSISEIEKLVNEGFISPYPKYIGESGTKSALSSSREEHFAELTALFFDSSDLSKSVKELLPETTEKFYAMLNNAKVGDIERIIPKHISGRDDIIRRMEATKQAIELVKTDDLKNIEQKISKLEEILDSDESFEKFFDSMYKRGVPNKTKEVTERVWRTKEKSWIDTLPEGIRDTAKQIEDDFIKWADEEGVDKIDNYVPHVLNYDLRKNKKAQKLMEMVNPKNIHELNRKYKGTIDEINKIMKEKHGIDNFFETNITRIYLERGIKHNRFMYQKEYLDQTMKLFGERIDSDVYKNMTPEARKAYFEQIQKKISSGDYVFVELDDKYNPVTKKTIENDEIAKGYARRNETRETARLSDSSNPLAIELNSYQINNPFIQIDPRKITEEKLFERSKNPIYIMPRVMHDNYLKTVQKQFEKQKNMFLDLYDKFTRLWKAKAVTSVGFHAQNQIGNMFNSYLSIGSKILDPELNKAAIQIAMGKGSYLGKSANEWQTILMENGIKGFNFFEENTDEFLKGQIDSLKDNPIKQLAKKLNPISTDNIVFSANRRIGGAIEEHAKIVNFLSHIRDGKSISEAKDLVDKFLFDYSDITDFEASFMKRVVPFYTWMRKNVPLQIENIINNPAKYNRVLRGVKSVSKPETEEQKRYRPEYLNDAIHLGDGEYLDVNLPYKDLGRLNMKDTFSGLNPLIKLLVETQANKNLYFGNDIKRSEGELVEPTAYQKLLPFVTKDTPNGKMIDPMLKYTLDSLNPDLKRFSNMADSLDESTLGRVSGFKTHKVDYEKEKKKAMYEYIQKLLDYEKNKKKQGYIK